MIKITDYEVEGCWTGLKSKGACRNCGTIYENVPKDGHFNSQYLELQKHDEERLVCCPKGCSVKSAEDCINRFLKIRNYCTDNSESWDYELDYTTLFHAWIDRTGKVFPVGIRGHVSFAYDRNTTESDLERKGWLKLSSGIDLFWEKKLSKFQIDFVFDYLVANNHSKQVKIFMKYSERTCRYFKIGKKDKDENI